MLKCCGIFYCYLYYYWLWCLEDNIEFLFNMDIKIVCLCSEFGWVFFNCVFFYDDLMWSIWNVGEIMIENECVFMVYVLLIKIFYSGYILGRVKLKGINYFSFIFYMVNLVFLI